jgi:uncharacterized protein YjiS (DUF1127 family)
MSGYTTTHATARRNARGAESAWAAWMREALRTIGTRRHLAQMDDRMLKDIGLTRSEALEEAGRAPWDVTPVGRR